MRSVIAAGAFALMAGCAGGAGVPGGWGMPSFADLQRMCGATVQDYGADAQPVYSTLLDAWVAQRHGALPQSRFCAFKQAIAERHAALGASADPAARGKWAAFFNEERARALSWRAAVDPSLRGG